MSTRQVAGVWQRQWEEDPLGDSEGADRDTLVLWTQAPTSGLYVDIRLPKGSPGRSLAEAKDAGFVMTPSALEARGLSMSESSKVLNEQVIDILYRQKSFGGQLQYTLGDTTSRDALAKDRILAQLANDAKENQSALGLCTCFWRRDIDYQPPSGGLDIGVCASAPPNVDGSIDLRETGDDASYAEGWHRLPGTAEGPSFALKLITENDVQRSGFWVRTGNKFAYAVGRPKDKTTAKALGCHEKCSSIHKCVGKSLEEASKLLIDDITTRLLIIGSYIGLYGEVSDSGIWTILHSTNPCLVGCTLVGAQANDDGFCCSTLSQNGGNKKIEVGNTLNQSIAGNNGIVRTWEVIEIDGNSNLPGFD